MLAVLVGSMVASLLVGAYPMSAMRASDILLHEFWPFSGWAHPVWDLREVTVMEVIRPPRVLVAAFAGVALGLAGTALQGMMRNPLVGPDLVGVSSGAAAGGVLAILLGLGAAMLVLFSFLGGLIAMSCTFGFAGLIGIRADGIALILVGFFVGAFFMALAGLMLYLAPGQGPGIQYWLMGTFRGADPTKVWTIAVPTTVCGAVLMGLRWRLNLLSLGDTDARALGLDLKGLRWTVIAIVTLLVAAQVAVSGVIGWVGLVIPHFARMLVGPDHRRLIPTAALLGGLFTLGLDDVTRTLVFAELPVSVLTAFIGTPMICILFWKTQSRGWSAR
jgi:iron complex transport system permease protein